MNSELTFKNFLFWIVAGMGFHIGWAIIQLIIGLLAQALGR